MPRVGLPLIAPSVLASDLACLGDEAKRMNEEGCDWLHLDVMDGHFVPNISFGHGTIQCLRKHVPDAFLDVHLMVSNPKQWIEPLSKAKVNNVTFHWESFTSNDKSDMAKQVEECASLIRTLGIPRCGLAIKPNTPFEDVHDILKTGLFSLLLIMTVEPGFGGQSFMHDMANKIRQARQAFPVMDIQVDGGLDKETVVHAAAAGANVIVAGTSIFKSENPRVLMDYMRDVIVSHQ